MTRLSRMARCIVLSLGICSVSTNAVSADLVEEYTLKAALVLNFARFTEWPADVFDRLSGPFRLCVHGDTDVQQAFASLEGKKVGDRQMSIKRINRLWNVQGCHVLFVSGTDRGRLRRVFSAIEGQPVMTVGEMRGFAKSGGTINLVIEDNKIRFQINLEAARRAGLTISSRLLKLATIVDGDERRMTNRRP